MKKFLCILIIGVIIVSITVFNSNAMVSPYYYGEVNLDYDINILDATDIQLYLSGLTELTPLKVELADVDGDMDVSVMDATLIQMYSAKLIDGFDRSPNYLYTMLNLMRVGANFDSGKAMKGVPVTFKPYAYAYSEIAEPEYKLEILEGSVSDVGTVLQGDVMNYTFNTAGVYLMELTAYNKFSEEEKYSFEYEVVDKVSDELIVSALYVNNMYLDERSRASFTAHAYGGEAPYLYRFEDVRGSVLQDYSEGNECVLHREGYYPQIVVRVRDANGNVAVSQPYSYNVYDTWA